MVSPSARPSASIAPPTTPERAEGQHHPPHHFPGGAAQAVGGFLQHRRHGLEHIARHRRNEGQDHDRKDQAGGEDADAVRRAAEQGAEHGNAGDGIDDRLLDMGLEPGREHEQAPDAVDDGGDAGQQARWRCRSGGAAAAGTDSVRKIAMPMPTGTASSMAEARGDQGAVDRRPGRRTCREVGFQASDVRKEKPNALKAGMEPITSEMMTPGKDQQNRRPRPAQVRK